MIIKQLIRLLPIVFCLVVAPQAGAHEVRPDIATATFLDDGTFEIKIIANAEFLIAGISPNVRNTNDSPKAAQYDALRALSADALTQRFREFAPTWLAGIDILFDGQRVQPKMDRIKARAPGNLSRSRLTTIYLTGKIPPRALLFRWRYAAKFGSVVLRVKQVGDEKMIAYWLKNGTASKPIPISGAIGSGTFANFIIYTSLGFTHIVPLGIDHILFVLGLYLLSTRIKPLLIQVTTFTVAHSITLGLGLFGVVQLSPAIVEPLIAASIVFVALENLMTDKLTVWRPYVVFAFGLVHGLGFAGVLREIGLARADFVTGLVAFNVGVEFGQLAVITAAFFVTGLWFRNRPWYRDWIVKPSSLGIGAMGAFWFVQRII